MPESPKLSKILTELRFYIKLRSSQTKSNYNYSIQP